MYIKIKLFDGEAPGLEIWRMGSTPSLPLLPGSLLPGVVVLDRVLFMGQIGQTMRVNYSMMHNCNCYITIFKTVNVIKMYVQIIYIFNIYV